MCWGINVQEYLAVTITEGKLSLFQMEIAVKKIKGKCSLNKSFISFTSTPHLNTVSDKFKKDLMFFY